MKVFPARELLGAWPVVISLAAVVNQRDAGSLAHISRSRVSKGETIKIPVWVQVAVVSHHGKQTHSHQPFLSFHPGVTPSPPLHRPGTQLGKKRLLPGFAISLCGASAHKTSMFTGTMSLSWFRRLPDDKNDGLDKAV